VKGVREVATFTQEELATAVEIHRMVKALNARARDAERLGLDVALRVKEREEVFEPEPGTIHQVPGVEVSGVELKVLVFKAIVVEAAGATSEEPPDVVLPHGWMG
jgi:hypothetical protein